jgi:thiamine pyrophosphokinase
VHAPSRSTTVVVFTGGDSVPASVGALLPDRATVIAADSGAEHALAMGRVIDVAVGDFDSLLPSSLEAVERAGARIERHPADKDRTDLEIALDGALELGAREIVVVGGHGGRLDHFLANALLLASPKYAAVSVSAFMGAGRLFVVRERLAFAGTPGQLVSLLALHEPATGVSTEGLRWELRDDTLLPGSSRGVSNEHLGTEAVVSLDSGVLVVVQPG